MVHSLNEKKMGPKREIYETRKQSDTADPFVSTNIEPPSGDVAFGEDEDDAT